MQGNRTNHPPRNGMRYWTRRRQQELEHWEQRRAIIKAPTKRRRLKKGAGSEPTPALAPIEPAVRRQV